jgi:hypothetical protein
MRAIILNIMPYAIWMIAFFESVITILFLIRWHRKKQPIDLLAFLISVGLILDAVIIGLGFWLQPEVLKSITPVRFIAHGVLIPLLIPICGYAMNFNKTAMRVLWIITTLLMAAGLAQSLCIVLEQQKISNVIRYVASPDTPKWANVVSNLLSFGTIIPLMITGIIVWFRQKTPYLFLSAFFMFFFTAIGPATGNTDLLFFISMIGEAFMVFFLYLYAKERRS